MARRKLTPFVLALYVAAILAVTVAVLFALGRVPICECGYVALWSGDVASSQNSQQIADPYSLTHIIHGIGFFFLLWLAVRRLSLGARFLIAMGVESLWEIIENTSFIIDRYRAATISLDYYGDSIINSIGDIIVAGFGFWLASKFPIWATIFVVVLLEVALAFLIRDGLFLNVLMLVHPIDAIKTWQMGA